MKTPRLSISVVIASLTLVSCGGSDVEGCVSSPKEGNSSCEGSGGGYSWKFWRYGTEDDPLGLAARLWCPDGTSVGCTLPNAPPELYMQIGCDPGEDEDEDGSPDCNTPVLECAPGSPWYNQACDS